MFFFPKINILHYLKYVLQYTNLVPLSGSPCLNYPIIHSYYIYLVLIVQNLATRRLLTFGRHLIFILHFCLCLYIYFLVIHPLSIHFSMYLILLMVMLWIVLDFTRGCLKMWGFVCEMMSLILTWSHGNCWYFNLHTNQW